MTTITVDHAVLEQALEALVTAEAGLADIGDADREQGDDVAWCEARAATALEGPRAAITALRDALAQPLPDPVDEYRKGFIDGQIDMRDRPEERKQEQATGKESLQVEFKGGGQIATPLQLTANDLAWLETRRLVRVWKELGEMRWMGADDGWDRAIEAVRARLDKECQDVLAWKEKVEASEQTAAQLLQKLRGMKDD